MPRPVDSSDLDRLGGDLRQEMSVLGAPLRREIHTSAEDVRTHVAHVVAELGQEIRDSEAETRRRMEQFEARFTASLESSAAETCRYFGVVAEDLKSDIKAVAEGLGALDEKVERCRGEVREDFGRVDRRLLHLEVRVIGRSDPA